MNEEITITPETAAAKAFELQAPSFDKLYGNDTIIQYKRKRVRDHVMSFIPANACILELNAGTGEDAVYFANNGFKVHATDISTGMLDQLKEKIRHYQLERLLRTENCSFTELHQLTDKGPYDLVFSNFAGLNCTDKLVKVLESLSSLTKTGGYITLVLLPKFCLWESLLLFKGKFKTAFRRFSGSKGTPAKIDDQHFRCWYYNPSFITKHLSKEFALISVEGLCTLVPPSYMQNFAEKHPGLYRFLEKKENRLKAGWPWRSIGDYYIITLRKRS